MEPFFFRELTEEAKAAAARAKTENRKPYPQELATVMKWLLFMEGKELACAESKANSLEEWWAEQEERKRAGRFPYFERVGQNSVDLVGSIPFPPHMRPRSILRPKRVLELYCVGMGPQEIAKKEKWPLKGVLKTLEKYGIGQKKGNTLVGPPYGWRIKRDRLVKVENEQWVLEKIAAKRKNGDSLAEVVRFIDGLGIKPRGGGVWFPRRVADALSLNKMLLVACGSN